MKQIDGRGNWDIFIEEFNKQNRMRLTRLGEIKATEMLHEYWIEDDLPLAGVDLNTEGEDAPLIDIMLGGAEEDVGRRMTHTVRRARKLRIQLTINRQEEGLEIEDAEGVTTILRFES